MKISEILENEIGLTRDSLNIRKSFIAHFSMSDAKKVWLAIGRRLTGGKYKIDISTGRVVIGILKWALMDKSFNGDLQKGLFLSGNVGCGKTLTLKIFVEFMQYANKTVATYSALEIVALYKSKESRGRLFVAPLFIDDIGTEPSMINNFGTKEYPVYEIFNRRYLDRRFLMFITTNLGPQKIEDKYDDRVRDRIKEMFNIIPIAGRTRR